MSILDDIAKGATDAVNFAAKKTGEVTGVAKMKLALHSEQSNLDECYKIIGKLTHDAKRENKDNTAAIDAKMAEADSLCDKIESIKREIADVQDSVICKTCQTKINKDYEFCPVCGSKQK